MIYQLTFDDPEQPLPNPGVGANLYVYPEPSKKAWISAYFMNSRNRVGVYVRTATDQAGQEIFDYLDQYREEIREELGEEIIWVWDDRVDIGIRLPCDDVFAPENREDIKAFFKEWLNTLVNVFRPRLKRR